MMPAHGGAVSPRRRGLQVMSLLGRHRAASCRGSAFRVASPSSIRKPPWRPGPKGRNASVRSDWRCSVGRSEEHTSELQSLMRISYAVFCLKKQLYQIIHNLDRTHSWNYTHDANIG